MESTSARADSIEDLGPIFHSLLRLVGIRSTPSKSLRIYFVKGALKCLAFNYTLFGIDRLLNLALRMTESGVEVVDDRWVKLAFAFALLAPFAFLLVASIGMRVYASAETNEDSNESEMMEFGLLRSSSPSKSAARVDDIFQSQFTLFKHEVRSLGNKASCMIVAVSLLLSLLQFPIAHLNGVWTPLYVLKGMLRLSFLTLSISAMIVPLGVCVLLLRQALLNFVDGAKLIVDGAITESVAGCKSDSTILSLDIIAHQRFSLEQLISGLSTRLSPFYIPVVLIGSVYVYASLFALLAEPFSMWPGLRAGLSLGLVSALTLILGTLAVLASVNSADKRLFDALLEIRSQFPCSGIEPLIWKERVLPLRNDLDSLISLVRDKPVGFRIAGFLITIRLVQTVAYTILSTLPIVVQYAVRSSDDLVF